MAFLDDQKISFELSLLPIVLNSISFDPENKSKCYPKTLKNGQN